ncbi:hypothetical protein ES707_22686 [subsurface metagenome]
MTTWLLWECLKPEVQAELRALMPVDWEPPSSNHRRMKFDCRLESLEEIDRLMRRRPRYLKARALLTSEERVRIRLTT